MPDHKERESLLHTGNGLHNYLALSTSFSSEGQIADIETGFGPSEADLMVSGVQEITLSWHNIHAFVPQASRKLKSCWSRSDPLDKPEPPKHILKNVSGFVKPGQLLAIMGASGAGKTTLLDTLTMRRQSKLTMQGLVLINGHVVNPTSMTSISAYVQQDDLFIGTLTVREHLRFQALVRMHRSISYKQRMKRVQEVIVELGLSKCADTIIGVPSRIKGISGGEMKRLAFASEVLTNPPLMFCDEPTSGLDSFMAQNVVAVLKQMAQRGKSIICTIHQPSSELYTMFDSILFLAEGRTAYLGDPRNALHFFKKNGYICPSNYNPADYFVQTLAVVPGKEETCRKTVSAICDAFCHSPEGRSLKQMDEQHEGKFMNKPHGSSLRKSPYKASWWAQFCAVLWRSAVSILREPLVVRMRMYQTSVIAIVLGLLYLNQGMDQNGVQNINGAMFLMLTNMTFQNYFGVINVFCLELPIFLREHWNGMYRTDVYFLAKTLAELPIYIIIPTVFTTIMYWMVGLYPDPGKFFTCLLIVTLVANCACSFGYMISCMSNSITMALSLGPPLLTPLLLFGGFFLNTASIPSYALWVQYISWFKYSNEALNINQWKDVNYIACPRDNMTCLSSGKMILDNYYFVKEDLWFNIGMLLVLLVVFRLIGYIFLYMKARRRN